MKTQKQARNEALGLLYKLQSWYHADENKVELLLSRQTYQKHEHEIVQALYKLRQAQAQVVIHLPNTNNPEDSVLLEISFHIKDQNDPLFDTTMFEDNDMSLCEHEDSEYTPVDVWRESPDDPTTVSDNGGKQSELKMDWTLVPWDSLVYVARVLETGAAKYGRDNWKLLPPDDHAKHRIHHAIAATHLINDDLATEERITHLSHEICRALFEIHTLTNF